MTMETTRLFRDEVAAFRKENADLKRKLERSDAYFDEFAEVQEERLEAAVKKAVTQEKRADALDAKLREAESQIFVAVQDIDIITSRHITHPQKNAALWLISQRLMQMIQMPYDHDDLPF